MNVFYLHPDPYTCARLHCDKHVRKMIIEYAQMMSTAHRILDGDEKGTHPTWNDRLYKKTHFNHPSAKWVRSSKQRYWWTYILWQELCRIYERNAGRRHATSVKLDRILVHPPRNIDSCVWEQPPQCMPDSYKRADCVEAYRAYYSGDKREIATWKLNSKPEWFDE